MNLTVIRFWALVLLVAGSGIGYYLYKTTHSTDGRHFAYGLDLVGGSHLVYEADTSKIDPANVEEAMSALRDVIERRVNVFGVSEPLVQVEKASAFSDAEKTERLIVELPGVTDLEKAIEMIGATPQLEFKLVGAPEGTSTDEVYIDTGLTGQYLTSAQLQFSNGGTGYSNEPLVMVDFNEEGKDLFAKITKEHVNEQLAIFLDGVSISQPYIREEIRGGTATISGSMDAVKAKELVRNLNIGALPVPIQLVSTESVGASLGIKTLSKGVAAGLSGIGIVMLFLILWYRIPGVLASVALAFYLVLNLAVYLLIPVTITAAGLAGLILSSGMAVDANILIFERMKDELRNGKKLREAVKEGVSRAWLPIRDGNLTGILSALVLYWFGTASVQGFALTLIIGIFLSMFTAIIVTRTFLLAFAGDSESKILRTLFLCGKDMK